MVELIGKVKALIHDEVVKADTDSGDGLAIVGDHSEAEGDGHQQTGEPLKMKARHGASSGCRESALHAVPADENDGEGAEHVPAHGFEKSGVLGHELRQIRKEVIHAARWHRSTPV